MKDLSTALRGEGLKLGEDELASHRNLDANDGSIKMFGQPTRVNTDRSWWRRQEKRYDQLDCAENVRAQLRVIVKRILRKHGYPPDKQEK